jgi:hypothetical protein
VDFFAARSKKPPELFEFGEDGPAAGLEFDEQIGSGGILGAHESLFFGIRKSERIRNTALIVKARNEKRSPWRA